jgi:hypothetical protein
MLTAEYAENHSFTAPFSRPILTESASLARSTLLRGWLRWCDKEHAECERTQAELVTALPARLLYVGDLGDQNYKQDRLCLIGASEATTWQYVALSHCWGQLSKEEQKMVCTTQDNIARRLQGFSMSELPKTFQDAVTVTRELNVLYLWIDSLCIIQYEDSLEDWNRESGRMEGVFSQAYCTIAATVAADSNAGFLERDIRTGYVYVRDTSGNEFYVSNDIDNFDEDVVKAKLNTRAWVMQEAVLARRTIQFSANQVYWECGEGVYCENFARLERHNLCVTTTKEPLTIHVILASPQTSTSRSTQTFQSGSSPQAQNVH